MLVDHCTRAGSPRKGELAFAAPPHDLVADPRLSPTDVRVASALLYWARAKAVCWPSDATIGRRVGRSPGTVQRSLRRLEQAGWIRREKTNANRTGRLIILAWRADGARPAPAPMIDPPAAPARDEEDVIVKGESTKGPDVGSPERSRPDPAAAPDPAEPREGQGRAAKGGERASRGGGPITAPLLASWLASEDPILKAEAARRLAPPRPGPERPRSVPDLLSRIREDPAHVAAAAELLAQDLDDRKSWSGFHAACRRAWSGECDPGALVAAWREATSGRARSPGAVFMAVLKRENRVSRH